MLNVQRGRFHHHDRQTSWTENHIYKLADGKRKELWPGGGPELG
jgi:hypothetical protein